MRKFRAAESTPRGTLRHRRAGARGSDAPDWGMRERGCDSRHSHQFKRLPCEDCGGKIDLESMVRRSSLIQRPWSEQY